MGEKKKKRGGRIHRHFSPLRLEKAERKGKRGTVGGRNPTLFLVLAGQKKR